jgi:hypothetical protein
VASAANDHITAAADLQWGSISRPSSAKPILVQLYRSVLESESRAIPRIPHWWRDTPYVP